MPRPVAYGPRRRRGLRQLTATSLIAADAGIGGSVTTTSDFDHWRLTGAAGFRRTEQTRDPALVICPARIIAVGNKVLREII